MGLWSKVKKGAKKAWKGVKKVVKKVARTVKKVSKKVAYAVPGGKQLWDFSSKVGKKVSKGIKKIGKKIMKGISKLGPVGIIAIQLVLSATGIGAGIAAAMGSMWSAFGATAAAAAQAGSVLGAVGNAIYTGVNWAAGTLGAVGSAISEGAAQLMGGNFSAAAQNFGANMTKALTGEAGKAAVQAGVEQAAISAAKSAAGQGWLAQAAEAGSNALANSGGALSSLGEQAPQQSGMIDTAAPQPFNTPDTTSVMGDGGSLAEAAGIDTTGVGAGSYDPTAGFDASTMFQDPAVTNAQATAQSSAVPTFNAADAVKPQQASLLDQAVSQGTDLATDATKDYVKSQAKSLLSPKHQDYGEPAAGYPAATSDVGMLAQYDRYQDAYKSYATEAHRLDFGGGQYASGY